LIEEYVEKKWSWPDLKEFPAFPGRNEENRETCLPEEPVFVS